MLYLVHYAGHLNQLETMRNIGDLNEMSLMEMTHLSPGLDSLHSMEAEIGNLSP